PGGTTPGSTPERPARTSAGRGAHDQQASHDRERIVPDDPRLHAPQARAAPREGPAEPIHEAVDDVDVERPRRAGEGARGLDDAMVVELVEVVLVHEDSVIRARGAGGRGGIGPMAHVHRYSDRDADE